MGHGGDTAVGPRAGRSPGDHTENHGGRAWALKPTAPALDSGSAPNILQRRPGSETSPCPPSPQLLRSILAASVPGGRNCPHPSGAQGGFRGDRPNGLNSVALAPVFGWLWRETAGSRGGPQPRCWAGHPELMGTGPPQGGPGGWGLGKGGEQGGAAAPGVGPRARGRRLGA